MTARILPPAEWSRLEATEGSGLQPAWRQLPVDDVTVIVVEDDDGVIVACWSLFAVYHVEGVWVAPAHRKRGVVAGRLLAEMRRVVHARGVAAVATAAESPEVVTLLETLGATRLPGDAYQLPMGEA